MKLCHFGARDYIPGLGRWLQRDPLNTGMKISAGYYRELNGYEYGISDPINNIDPSGLASCLYAIGQHTLSCTPNAGGRAIAFGAAEVHSGISNCKNNIDCIGRSKEGPVQPGRYSITRNPTHKKWWLLHPSFGTRIQNLPSWRGGFNIHLGSYSEGCITCNQDSPGVNLNYELLNSLFEAEDGANFIEVTP